VTAAEKYVAAAYLVVFATVLAYVLIISLKLVRLEREVAELTELARARRVREREAAAQPPVRASGPVEGVRGNREVPPTDPEA
jgi:CcmD family protein